MDLAAAVAELKRSTDTFGPFIRTQAERFPDRVALKFEDETVSYGAYDRAVNRVAGRHPVRILADTPPATALPRDVRPLEGWRDGPEAPEPDIPDVRGGDVFLYIYTSGTTGYPKPAIVRHLRFTMGGITLAGLLGVEAGETIYAPLPLYHGESLFVGFAPAFRAGGAFASRRRFSASAFLDDVRRHQAVAFVYVGELCRYLLRLPPTPRDRDHRLRVAAGAGLRPDIWTAFQERFGIARIIEMYGATEGNAAPTASASRARRASRASCSAGSAVPWSTTATPTGRRASGSSCATPSRAATPGSAPATCCARTPTATTTSSIASATPSAGKARTSPRRRSPTSSAAPPGSRRRTCTGWRCRARTAAPAWPPSCSPRGRASTARRSTRAPSSICRPTPAPPSSAWCPRW